MKSETSQGEFFRHLRPKWFNRRRAEVLTDARGAVSFMLVPAGKREYDFWVNICPPTVTFSARQAVSTLRQVRASGAAPMGRVALDRRPIMQQLVEQVVKSYPPPYELGRLALQLNVLRLAAEAQAVKARPPAALKDYQND